MNQSIKINAFLLKVDLRQHSIHMVANHAMMKAIDESWKNVEAFCEAILQAHEKLYGMRLPISVNSLVLELLGHAYAYRILLKLRRFSNWQLLRKLSLRACIVDCGIKQYDSNRWFWDIAGILKPLLFLFSK